MVCLPSRWHQGWVVTGKGFLGQGWTWVGPAGVNCLGICLVEWALSWVGWWVASLEVDEEVTLQRSCNLLEVWVGAIGIKGLSGEVRNLGAHSRGGA